MIQCKKVICGGKVNHVCNIDGDLTIFEFYDYTQDKMSGRKKIHLEARNLELLARAFTSDGTAEYIHCVYENNGHCEHRIRFIRIGENLVVVLYEGYGTRWTENSYAVIHRKEFEAMQKLFNL